MTVTPAPFPAYPPSPQFRRGIVITTDIPGDSEHTVVLMAQADGLYLASPVTNIDFGDVAVGSSSTVTLTESVLAYGGSPMTAFILYVPTPGPFTTPSPEGSPRSVLERRGRHALREQ